MSPLGEAPRWQPKRWTLAEYLALPESKGRGCPNCGGLHYGAVNSGQREAPSVYRCHGTEAPNADGAPYQPSCGTLFRGRPNVHFDADWYAPFFEEIVADPAPHSGAVKGGS